MSQAKSGDKVKIHYTGKLEDGTEFGSSQNEEPLSFTIGDGKMIPGIEQAVIGMNPGDSKTTTIPMNEAYGPHQQEKVMAVDKNQIPKTINPEIGQQLQMERTDGEAITVRVAEISETHVTLDSNHPLAGHDLTFDMQLVEIA